MELLVGIDIGTTGCRAGVYTAHGELVTSAYRDYPLSAPAPGWVEGDPDAWWEATVANLHELFAAPGVNPRQIAAVGVSCTNALVAVDRHGDKVRPAIMRLDRRSLQEAAWLEERVGQEQVFTTSGNRIAAGTFSLPAMLWLARHEPQTCRRTFRYLAPGGFIVQRLTGAFTMDRSRANTTLLYDTQAGDWSQRLADDVGVDLAKLPRVSASHEVVGQVTRAAAQLTGLPKGTPVVAGCHDTAASLLGAGVTRPGQAIITLGTVGRLTVIHADRSRLDARFLNSYSGIGDRWQSTAVVNSAGGGVRWFRDQLGGEEVQAEQFSGTPAYVALDRLAASVPPGARGLLFLPYLAGEYSPLWDSNARGAYLGLSLAHGRAEMFRALLEGVALAFRQNLAIMGQTGDQIPLLYAAGGGGRSRLWLSIVASALERPIRTVAVSNKQVRGAALLAGLGVGLYSPETMPPASAPEASTVLPDPQAAEVYRRLYPVFTDVCAGLSSRFGALAGLADYRV